MAILPLDAETSQAYATNIVTSEVPHDIKFPSSQLSTPPTEHHVKIAAKETEITKAQTKTTKIELSFEVNPQEKSDSSSKKGKQE